MAEYTGRLYFKKGVTGKTQGDGAFEMDVSDTLNCGDHAKDRWVIQVLVTGAVSAGTLTVGAKVPDAPAFSDLTTTIDLSAGTPSLVTFEGALEALEFTPAEFDGTSYDVYVVAS